MEAIETRRATSAEVLPLRHRVLRPGRPWEAAILDGDDEPEARHWVAERRGQVVGVVSLHRRPWPEGRGPQWRLRGMAVDPDWQQRGIGTAMLLAIHAEVDAPLWCNARVTAVPFYQKHGWTVHSDEIDIPLIGPHQRMQRG